MKYFFIILLNSCWIFGFGQQPKLMFPVGHTRPLAAAAFSPDGKLVVTASDDGIAKIWDTESGVLLADLIGHTERIVNASFTSDGKRIVTGSADATIKIWDVKTAKLLKTLDHDYAVDFTFLSPDGKKIISGTSGMEVHVWDLNHYSLLTVMHNVNVINANSVSPDGNKIVLATAFGIAEIRTAVTGKLIGKLLPVREEKIDFQHQGRGMISQTKFFPDGKKIITVTNNMADIWNADTRKPITVLTGHSENIISVTISPDSKTVLTTSKDSSCKLWDATSGKLIFSLADPSSEALFSPDGNTIITCSLDGTAKIWNAKNGKMNFILRGHSDNVIHAGFSSNSKTAITASYDGTAVIWDVNTGEKKGQLKGNVETISRVDFSPDGKKMVIGGSRGTIWNAANNTLITVLGGYYNWVWNPVFSFDGKKIAGISGNTAKIWNAYTGEWIADIAGHGSAMKKISFSPDDKKLLTFSNEDYKSDTILKIWSAESGKLLFELRGHNYAITDARFSIDGKKIVSGSRDGVVKIWDGETGAFLYEVDHRNAIESIAFSHNGDRFITTSGDSSAKVWNLQSGTLMLTFKDHPGISSGCFSPDDKTIATTSWNGTTIWNAENGEKIKNLMAPYSMHYDATFSPDGKRIAARAFSEMEATTFFVWDVETGHLLTDSTSFNEKSRYLSFSPDNKKFITSFNNNYKTWNAGNGKLLYTAYIIDSTDYLIVDKEYRYDGSAAARKLIYFTCGTEMIGLDQVKEKLWVPDLAERILKGETINQAKLSEIQICQFVPEIQEKEEKGIYRFYITPRRGGLGESILYINNNETKRYKPSDLKKTATGYELDLVKDSVSKYFIAGKKNPVTVRSYTVDNAIISRGGEVIADETKKPAAIPNLYAVIIGVSNYKGNELDLTYADKDAEEIGKAIRLASAKLLNSAGGEHVYMYNLNTGEDRNGFPDKKSIQEVFNEIAGKATANDILLIFFAGHGTVTEYKNQKQFYFLTSDASVLADPAEAGISTRELIDWIRPQKIKAQKRILIMDACNSGQAINDIAGNTDVMKVRNAGVSDEKKEIERLNDQSGMFILSASASSQSAYEFSRYAHGLLTYSLLKAIKQQPEILEDGRYLNVFRWFSAATKSVTEIVHNIGRQEPQIVANANFNIGIVDSDVIAMIRLGEEKPMFTRSDFRQAGLRTDNLKLRNLIDKELSLVSARGIQNNIIYRSDYEGSDAHSLSGDYKINGDSVIVSFSLLKGNSEIRSFEIKGSVNDINKLVQEIINESLSALK
jgi:WD40 repeat protein